MIKKVKIGGGQRIQNRILAKLLVQETSKFAQPFDHLDHVQYMITDWTTIWHLGIIDGTRHFVPLYIVRRAKRLLQLLKDLIWLGLLKFATKLIIHRCQHNALDSSLIRNPLQISIPDQILSTNRREFGCWICYHIKNPLVLQDNPQFFIPTIEIETLQFLTIQKWSKW